MNALLESGRALMRLAFAAGDLTVVEANSWWIAEHEIAERFDGVVQPKGTPGHDVVCRSGQRISVKVRSANSFVEFHSLDRFNEFDRLIVCRFDSDGAFRIVCDMTRDDVFAALIERRGRMYLALNKKNRLAA